MVAELSPLHLLLVLVIAALVLAPVVILGMLLVAVRRREQPDPRALLAERLARGEISREDFDTAMRALAAGQASSSDWRPPAG